MNAELNSLAKKAIYSRECLELLFDNIYPLIWHFYRIRLKNGEDAMDLTQNACIKIVNNLDRYREQKSCFKTWMYTVIKNMLVDFFRRKSLSIDDEIDFELMKGVDSPVDSIIREEDKKALKEVFKSLTPRQKEILELKFFFNIRNRDIARLLDLNEKTVSSIISKSCEKLKILLEKIDF